MSTAVITIFVGWLADLMGLKSAFSVSALLGLAGIPIIFFLPKTPIVTEE
jgi:MFS family permease